MSKLSIKQKEEIDTIANQFFQTFVAAGNIHGAYGHAQQELYPYEEDHPDFAEAALYAHSVVHTLQEAALAEENFHPKPLHPMVTAAIEALRALSPDQRRLAIDGV